MCCVHIVQVVHILEGFSPVDNGGPTMKIILLQKAAILLPKLKTKLNFATLLIIVHSLQTCSVNTSKF